MTRGARWSRSARAGVAAAWLALGALPGAGALDDPASRSEPLPPLAGLALAEALELLRQRGVPIVYSSRVVLPEMRVERQPAASDPAAALEELLAPHGLTTRPGPEGRRIVVRRAELAPELRGVVRSRLGGAPVSGATVVVREAGVEVTSAPDGGFAIAGLAPGRYTLEARHPGFVVEELLDVAVPPAAGDALEFRLLPGAFAGEEIVVHPSRTLLLRERAATAVELDRDEIFSLPHLGDDVFRALALLPGIAANDRSAEFHVRGGRRDEVLVLLDGQELFQAFHLPEYDNALSLVSSAGLSSVSLTTGAFPAAYGDRMGGVLEMATVDPPDAPRHRLAASLLDLEASASRRFAGGHGSWFAAARRGTAELADELLQDERPGFWDLFAKAEWSAGERQGWGLRVLRSHDQLALREAGADEAKDVATEHDAAYFWLTHRWLANDRLFAETVLSSSATDRERGNRELDDERRLAVADRRRLEVRGLKQTWHWRRPHDAQWISGFEWRRFESRVDYAREREFETPLAALRTDPSEGSFRFAARPVDEHRNLHASRSFRPLPELTVQLGARYDEHSLGDERSVDPRLNAAWGLGERGVVRLGWGRFHQSQRTYELRVEDGETAFAPRERSEHWVLGYEQTFAGRRPRGWEALRVELFRRVTDDPRPRFENLLEPFDPFPEGESDRVRFAPDESRARGVELFAKAHAGDRVEGWIGYTYSESDDTTGGSSIPRLIDQSHAVTLDLNWRIDEAWTLNLAWLYHSGRPTTEIGLAFVPRADDGGGEPDDGEEDEVPAGEPQFDAVPVLGELNARRLSPYHRLDLRISRRWRLGAGALTLFADVQNLYDRANLAGFSVEFDEELGERGELVFDEELWPGFLASAGIAWEF